MVPISVCGFHLCPCSYLCSYSDSCQCSYLYLLFLSLSDWLSFVSTILYLSMVFVCAMIPVSALLYVSMAPICIYVPIGLYGFCLCVIHFCVYSSYLYLFSYLCLWFLYVSWVPISVYGFYLLSVIHPYVFLWLLYWLWYLWVFTFLSISMFRNSGMLKVW